MEEQKCIAMRPRAAKMSGYPDNRISGYPDIRSCTLFSSIYRNRSDSQPPGRFSSSSGAPGGSSLASADTPRSSCVCYCRSGPPEVNGKRVDRIGPRLAWRKARFGQQQSEPPTLEPRPHGSPPVSGAPPQLVEPICEARFTTSSS